MNIDLTPDQNRALEHEIGDTFGFDVEVDAVHDLGDGVFKAFVSYDDPKTQKSKHHGVKFSGRFMKHAVEDFKIMEQLDEKVHRVGGPAPKKGAPEPWERARAFDKVNPKTGKRPDRSFLKNYNPSKGKYHAIEFSDEEDFIMVLVMGDGKEFSYGKSVPYGKDHEKDPWTEYYGVNVLFFPDGTIDASTGDPTSKKQWHKDKDKIIAAAKAGLKDKDLPGIYDGLGGKSNKRGEGKLSFDVKESKLTFKQFLLTEANEDKLYTANAYGNGFDRAAVRKGEMLPTEDGDHVEFVRIDGNKLVVKVDGKEKTISPKDVLGVIKPKGEKPTDADMKKVLGEAKEEKHWFKKKADWNKAVGEIPVDDDGVNVNGDCWARYENKLVAKWFDESEEGWVMKPVTEGKKGKFGVKLGGVYTEKPEVGFEDRLNYEKAKSECKDAGIKFKTTSNFGIHYIIFDSEADQKKAVRLIKKVIDKSVESEW